MSTIAAPARLRLTIDRYRAMGERVVLGAAGSPLVQFMLDVDAALGAPPIP